MNLSKLWKIVRDSETWYAAAILRVVKSQTQPGNRTTTTESVGKRAASETSHSWSGESKCMSSCSLQVTWWCCLPIAGCFVTGLQWAIISNTVNIGFLHIKSSILPVLIVPGLRNLPWEFPQCGKDRRALDKTSTEFLSTTYLPWTTVRSSRCKESQTLLFQGPRVTWCLMESIQPNYVCDIISTLRMKEWRLRETV